MAVFYVENENDMVWKEVVLIKLNMMGIGGKVYNWIEDFLLDRVIQVRIGKALSRRYPVENGTPHGSIWSREHIK